MVKRDQAIIQTNATTINSLYDGYAGMLLGYISEIVKDQQLAEDYLVKVFSSIAKQFDEINWDAGNTWCQVQRFAKHELSAFTKATGFEDNTIASVTRPGSPNKYLDQMMGEQKHVFCSFYYSRKTTSQLAKELNKTEDLIKNLLKEAFAIIKKSHDN